MIAPWGCSLYCYLVPSLPLTATKPEPMDYFSILELEREPFSNSPDPDFFYDAASHLACLQNLELSIRLKRGLNVVMGRVGTGKTTLSRELVRRLDADDTIAVHLVLDPSYSSGEEFLEKVEEMLLGEILPSLSVWQRKERIKNALFRIGVAHHGTVVLLIDEGQKLSAECLEIIREFLNYETNTQKLLQVVIFAQEEFDDLIASKENFKDRINTIIRLGPMSFKEMRSMIRFRLEQSRSTGSVPTFSLPALWFIYRLTGGYPRKVIHLAHRILLTIIVQGKNKVAYSNVAAAAGTTIVARPSGLQKHWILGIFFICCLCLLGYGVDEMFQTGFWEKGQVLLSQSKKQTAGNEYKHVGQKVSQGNTDKSISRKQVLGENSTQASATQGVETDTFRIHNTATSDMGDADSRVLGAILVAKDDILSRMVQGIYNLDRGKDIQAVTQKVFALNPGLSKHPDLLEVGSKMLFPLPEKVDTPLAADRFWVRIAQGEDLDEAYRIVNHWRRAGFDIGKTKNSQKVALVISSIDGKAFTFTLLCNTSFVSKNEAQRAVDALPEGWREHSAVLTSTFFENKVLFSSLP